MLAVLLVTMGLTVVEAPMASATRSSWPSGWTNPAGSARWEDHGYNRCGYVTVNGQEWAHLGADSQGYKSGAVRSIGPGVVKRVIKASAPNNGLMIEHRSASARFTVLYQHVKPGLAVGAAVGAGTRIGTVANWPNRSNNHVHVSLIPGAYKARTSWYGYRNCATGAGSGGGHVNPIPWLRSHPATGAASTTLTAASNQDGRLEMYGVGKDGRVYKRYQSTAGGTFGDWYRWGNATF